MTNNLPPNGKTNFTSLSEKKTKSDICRLHRLVQSRATNFPVCIATVAQHSRDTATLSLNCHTLVTVTLETVLPPVSVLTKVLQNLTKEIRKQALTSPSP